MSAELSAPVVDDKSVWNVMAGLAGYYAVTVAYEMGLFEFIGSESKSIEEVASELSIDLRPAEMILLSNIHLGFLKVADSKYSLTEAAKQYLLKNSHTYFGALFDLTISNGLSFETVKTAIQTNKPQAYGSDDIFEEHEKQADLAKHFTNAMHSASMGPAMMWPKKVDLSMHKTFLDVGGGSGAHMIGALSQWEKLEGIIFDIPPVCEACLEIVGRYGLDSRVTANVGSFWEDRYPDADVHFYSQIFHDWPVEKCNFLAKRSYDALPEGGKIVIHEMLFEDDKTQGPLAMSGGNIGMLVWTEGQQYSGKEISQMLSQAGFKNIEVIPTFGYWSIVVGEK